MMNKFFVARTLSCLAFIFMFSACQEEENVKTSKVPNDQPKTSVEVTGGKLKLFDAGSEPGISLDLFPQVKKVSFKAWKAMTEVPKSGVFLVGSERLPLNFKEDLKEEGLTLHEDGTLVDAKGKTVTLFLQTETFQVVPDEPKSNSNARTNGNPFSLQNYSWNMYWKYDGGFCRDYQAWTKAYAWGPKVNGEFLPTKIEYIFTKVTMSGKTDSESCYNCQSLVSHVKMDFGCGWPAIGSMYGDHYAFWKDGNVSFTKKWSW